MSILDRVIGIVAPYECVGCRAEAALLCLSCQASLPKLRPQGLDTGEAYSVTTYEGIAKDLLWKLKSSGAQAAARVMATLITEALPPSRDYLIVPLPTATSRVRQRGYDQARLIAKALSVRMNLPYSDCLVRIGQAHQVGANRQLRLKQLMGAYRLKSPAAVTGRHVLLVDDVMTTGASLDVASQVLLGAGAKTVDAATFARA